MHATAETGILPCYKAVRHTTETLCEPLAVEDYGLQSMPDASPVKWHLAHTTWFFETFVLTPHVPGYRSFHADFGYLFNSYYNAVGDRHPRPQRGLLSRPTLDEVLWNRMASARKRINWKNCQIEGHGRATREFGAVADFGGISIR